MIRFCRSHPNLSPPAAARIKCSDSFSGHLLLLICRYTIAICLALRESLFPLSKEAVHDLKVQKEDYLALEYFELWRVLFAEAEKQPDGVSFCFF